MYFKLWWFKISTWFSRLKKKNFAYKNNQKSMKVGQEKSEDELLDKVPFTKCLKLTGGMLTLWSFCQLSMTCIVLHACFPGSGDRQSNQSHFPASLSLICSTHPSDVLHCRGDFNHHLTCKGSEYVVCETERMCTDGEVKLKLHLYLVIIQCISMVY